MTRTEQVRDFLGGAVLAIVGAGLSVRMGRWAAGPRVVRGPTTIAGITYRIRLVPIEGLTRAVGEVQTEQKTWQRIADADGVVVYYVDPSEAAAEVANMIQQQAWRFAPELAEELIL